MSLRRIAGIAGLCYVAAAAIENMEVLDLPTLGGGAADIRSLYDDQAFSVVTSFAGALALLAYAAFAAALFGLLRARERPGEVWSIVALVGGIGGPVLSAAGLSAAGILVANEGAGLSDDVVATLFDFYLQARIVSGIFVALFLLGIGVAARRSDTLPSWLASLAWVIAAPMAIAPLAAFTADHPLEVGVRIAFGLQTLWIFLTSIWLLLANGVASVTFVRRAAFLVLVMAAGLVGVALLAVPGGTGKFFAWGLKPEPLAAFAGGVYVGAAIAYGVALPAGWRQVRGLVAGAAVLSVSVLVTTLTHLDQFDFDRLQAWAWVVLFAGFLVVTASILAFERDRRGGEMALGLALWARLTLALICALLAALALALWIDPTGLADASPFKLPPLGGRFAGCWIALLAVLAGWGALRNRVEEARLPLLAITTLSAGALIAALRTIADLEPAGRAAAYIGAVSLLLASGALLLARLPGPALDTVVNKRDSPV